MSSYVFVVPFRTALNSNGVAIAGAKAVITATGTTTLSTVYTDSALTIAGANPIIADSAGRFPTRYLNNTNTYRLRIFDADADITTATPIEDIDPYTPTEQGAAASNPNYTYVINTLAAGSSATLAATGTYPNITLTFGIPRGAAGASGALSDGTYSGIAVSGTGTALDVVAGHVTLARMANLAENRIIGRQSAGAGVPEALTIGVAAGADIPDRDAGDTRWIQRTESLVNSIYIPASAMVAQTTNGAAVGSTETATNDIMRSTLDFDAATIEYAQFQIALGNSWNEGTVTVQFYWEAANTGDVVWGAQGVCISDDDVLDAAFGTAQTVTDSVTAVGDLMVSSATAAITLAGTPTAGDLTILRVYRNATSGSDTLAVDAKLLGVKVNFTTNAADDS